MIVRTPCSNTSTLDTWHLPPVQNDHHSNLHVNNEWTWPQSMWFVKTSNNELWTPIPSARCTILVSAPHSFSMFANRSTIANPWLGRHCAQNTKGQEIKQPNCKLLRPFYLSCVFNSRTFIFVPCLQLISIGPVFSYFRCFRGHVDCQTTWPLGVTLIAQQLHKTNYKLHAMVGYMPQQGPISNNTNAQSNAFVFYYMATDSLNWKHIHANVLVLKFTTAYTPKQIVHKYNVFRICDVAVTPVTHFRSCILLIFKTLMPLWRTTQTLMPDNASVTEDTHAWQC